MKYTVFVVTVDSVDLWYTEDFKNAYDMMYAQVSESSENAYMYMYEVPTTTIDPHISWWEFQFWYKDAIIDENDYDKLWIKEEVILEWTCCDDIKWIEWLAKTCDLSFKKQ